MIALSSEYAPKATTKATAQRETLTACNGKRCYVEKGY